MGEKCHQTVAIDLSDSTLRTRKGAAVYGKAKNSGSSE